MMADAQEIAMFLLPCSICSRTFRSEALQRHEKVCEKTQTKKRKVFDSFKSRVQGTELEEFLGPAPLPGQPVRATPKSKTPEKNRPTKLPQWKQTHTALIETFRAARGNNAPAPSSTLINGSAEQCPTCCRNFGPRAYDRHVEFCREMMSRKARAPVKYSPAQERQAARVKYRAPLAIKRRDVSNNRSNATPTSSASASATRNTSTALLRPATTIIKSTSLPVNPTQPHKTSNFERSGSVRSSLRIRGVSPTKLPSASEPKRSFSSTKRNINVNAEREAENKDAINRTKSLNDGNVTYSTRTLESIMATAQKQMRELMSWSSDSDTPEPKSEPSTAKILPPLTTSPASAFTPVTPNKKYQNQTWPTTDSSQLLVDENENENENEWGNEGGNDAYKMLTSTPILKPKPAPRTPSTIRRNVRVASDGEEDRRRISRSSIGSQPSDSTLPEEGVLWPTVAPPLTKSRKKNFARSKSVFEDRNRMLFLQTYDATSSDDELEAKRSEDTNILPSYCHRPSSPVDHVNQDAIKGGGDSAYSSLNRRSPRSQEDILPKRKASKFCHECGSKFPVSLAKFCCECGVKRLLV